MTDIQLNIFSKNQFEIYIINNNYNEIFSYILDDIDNNGDSHSYLISLQYYKNDIDFTKFKFDQSTISKFEDAFEMLEEYKNNYIEEYNDLNYDEITNEMFQYDGPTQATYCILALNIETFLNPNLDLLSKINILVNLMINNDNDNLEIYCDDNPLSDYIDDEYEDYYTFKNKIKILYKFINKYATNYAIYKLKHKKIYKVIMVELKYHPRNVAAFLEENDIEELDNM